MEVRELSHPKASNLVRSFSADVALTLTGRENGHLIHTRSWAEPLMLVTALISIPS